MSQINKNHLLHSLMGISVCAEELQQALLGTHTRSTFQMIMGNK